MITQDDIINAVAIFDTNEHASPDVAAFIEAAALAKLEPDPLPTDKDLEKEAEMKYVLLEKDKDVFITANGLQLAQRAAYIQGRQVTLSRVKVLEAENLRYRDALCCIIGRIEGVEWEGLEEIGALSMVKRYADAALNPPTTNKD
jgi:hypothetical protein